MRAGAMAVLLVAMVGCGDDNRRPSGWETRECADGQCDVVDDCINGGCDYYDECWNGGCDYYDECLNGGCDWDSDDCADGGCEVPDAPPAGAALFGERVMCEVAPRCGAECFIDVLSGESDCDLEQRPGGVVIDMTLHEALTIRAHLNSPQGIAFHLGDSPSNDGYGGDGAEFSNDAELFLVGGGLYVYGSDHSLNAPDHVRGIPDLLPPEGGTLELTLADGMLSTRTESAGVCLAELADDLLRLDADDTEGAPDRLWYMGLNQVYAGGRGGSGLERVELCFH